MDEAIAMTATGTAMIKTRRPATIFGPLGFGGGATRAVFGRGA
jgi:hypothetical protein